MHSPADAEKIILEHVPVLPAEDCPLEQAHGRVLRASLIADRDFPPYDRVMMDGYALHLGNDTTGAPTNGELKTFRITGLQAAGMMPLSIKADNECIEIATGAVLPSGADTIVPYEDTIAEPQKSKGGASSGTMSLNGARIPTCGQYVHRRGSDHNAGDVICSAGVRLSSREIAAAASCGYTRVRVSALPRVAIVTTGDELVDVSNQSPAPHQIRRSNDYALRAALLEAGYPNVDCIHLHDIEKEIEAHLKQILSTHDVVIVTGGVSKGRFDLVPEILAKLGVEKKVQGISQRPGKPMWFGITPRNVPVFALPGNPVSTYVCFHRYVIPALAHMSKQPPRFAQYIQLSPNSRNLSIASGIVTKAAQLTHYVPVKLDESSESVTRLVDAMPANTSGDFTALIGSDGFIEVVPAQQISLCGQDNAEMRIRFYSWR